MSARTERDEALVRVEAGTDPNWAMMAEESVARLARSGEPFSSDDVWEALSFLQVEAPREPRAMGPVMRRMIMDNVITATGFAVSRRRHGGTVRMYGSAVPVIVPEPELEVWRNGRLVNLSTPGICVHSVGTTSGMWCGGCNTHSEHPDLQQAPVAKKLKVAPVCELCEAGHDNEHHCRYCGRQARLLTRVSSSVSTPLYDGPKT
jgi:hypothetical protein